MRTLIFPAVLIMGLTLEHFARFRLRPVTQPKARRVIENLVLSLTGSLPTRLLFLPVWIWASNASLAMPWSLSQWPWLSFLALDYTLYVWHYALHRVPLLWRFHSVHHSDLDMDVSTAARFHFGELFFSGIFRTAQILIIGVDLATLAMFEILVTSSAQFHHANLKLPEKWDRWLCFLTVTPRMHTVHHSRIESETHSNFSTVFSIWDRLHRTFRSRPSDAAYRAVEIGLPVSPPSDDIKLPGALWFPFRSNSIETKNA